MRLHDINFPEDQLAEFARRNHVRRLSPFGSILSDEFDAESDVDVLIEFFAGATPVFFAFACMQMELTNLLGRRVDLRTPNDLSRYFRDSVMREAVVQYAA